MKKILLFLLFASFFVQTKNVEAVKAGPKSGDLIQPNGEKVTVQKFGDEYFHWTQSIDGYTLIDWAGNPTNKPITNIAENAGVITFDFMGGDTRNPGSFAATASSSSQIDLSWTLNTSSDPVLLAWSSDGTFGTPVDGSTYSAGNSIPGGGTVLQYGPGTSYSHTSLSASTTYYYKTWSYDGSAYTTGITDNATTLCAAVSAFPYTQNFDAWTTSTPAATCTSDGTVTLEDCWENVTGDAIDWDVYTGSTGTSNTGPSADHTSGGGNYLFTEASGPCNSTGYIITTPFDFSALTSPTLTFWYHMYGAGMGTLSVQASIDGGTSWSADLWSLSGDQGDAWFASSVDLAAYAGNSNVILRFAAAQGADFTSDMAIDDVTIAEACTPPTTQASNFSVDAANDNDITISWTRGNGDGVIVVAKKSTAVDTGPTDGVSYIANAAFASGDQIGPDTYVVYQGTGTSVQVTSLSSGSDYYFAIYEYATATNCYLTPALSGSAATTGPLLPTYCAASGGGGEHIAGVELGTISNTGTAADGYADYTTTVASTDLKLSGTYNITITNGISYERDDLGIWIDFNQDGDFEDAGENVVCTEDDGANETYSFSIPDTASLGKTVMRIRIKYGGAGCGSPCYTTSNGEVEDYLVNIIADVTFNVDDGTNPIAGADVNLNGYGTQATDGAGQTVFSNVSPATGIGYSVAGPGFALVKGTVDVSNANVTENVTLTDPGYNVTFTIDNGTNPVQGADVTFTGYGTQTTDAAGQTTFTNVGSDATGIAYTVSAVGYGDGSGSVIVGSSDVAESVTLIPDLITIYDIQYTTDPSGDSPHNGNVVRTSGIVTALKSNGFYMQDGPGAWNGILVYTAGAPTVSLADEVEVIGEVDEYFGETEISTPSSVTISTLGNTLPASIALSTTDVNDEKYEGVLVSVTGAQVTANTTDPNVDWTADDGSGSVNLDENMYDPGYINGNTYNITGVVRYSDNSYRIQPRVSSDVQVVFTVTFNISDGSNPVAGADITFADYGTLTTDGSGQAIFTQIIPGTGLGYLVEATGYDLANGTIDVVDANVSLDTTLNASLYCHALANLQAPNEYINAFEFGTINNTLTGIGFGGYQDFTSISADIEPCSIYTFTITEGSAWGTDQGRIWIDWNQDGDFEDDGELIFESEVGTGPFSGSIEVPITATTGQTRMRVRVWATDFEATGVNGGSCGNENYGEVEDYTVNVLPVPPAELTVSVPSFDFGDVEVGNTSAESTYTVYGAYLPNDIVITAPTGFEISVTAGAGFTNSITITPDNGSVPDTTIYARFNPATEQSYTGNITHVSTGATQQNIAVNGYGYFTYTVSGNLTYDDGIPTPMNNVNVNLDDVSATPVASTITDAAGYYEFTGIRNGEYYISPDASLTWDGVTAMDITAYKKHIGNIPGFVLSGLALESGDVNANGTLTGIDLVFVKQRILGDISSFISGDWLHSDNSVLVDAANATVDLQAMCYGDANASYYTGTKSLTDIDVIYEENMAIPGNGQFEIPVSVKTAMSDLASMTLMFEYDNENLEINEITMTDNHSDLTYSIGDGIARMVYSTINPTDFVEDQILFYIKGQVLDASGDIEIASNTVGEFGDFNDNVLHEITLSAPLLTSPTGIGEGSLSDIKVYPNPTNAFINITNVANARVEICNVYGSLIRSEVTEKSVHKVDVSNLTRGTYLIKIYKDNKLIMRKFSVTK